MIKKRKKRDGSLRGLSALFDGFDLKRGVVFTLIFSGAAVVAWGVLSLMKEPVVPITWQSCLVEQDDGSTYPVMEEVPAGVYALPVSLVGGGPGQIVSAEITSPFLVQKEEVKLREFKKYADYVMDLPDSADKERLLVRLGVSWKKGDKGSSAVNAVSWEGARDYAHWLGQRTGCSYDIPSYDEWLATVSFLQSRDKSELNGAIAPSGPLKNLLWGVREWSRTWCASGYYLLGRDDLTTNSHEDSAVCMPPMFSVAGFRLVLNPAQQYQIN
ncbi:MAG: SUMF1/EgtB/PvdO family nonheme iron enzyme [Magnetococcales bacterium]|nr:SUMF1/EgtB/PvdO family nonheme iron enzyme [Magnetococcales bacterium]